MDETGVVKPDTNAWRAKSSLDLALKAVVVLYGFLVSSTVTFKISKVISELSC